MTDQLDKQYLEQIMQTQKSKILETMKQSKEAAQTVSLDQSRQGRLSRMDALQQQAMVQARLQRQQNELRRIEKTLARLYTQDYGYCTQCDELIEWERLVLNPTLELCSECMKACE